MRQEEILAVAGAILVLVLLCCGGLAVLLSKKREVAKAEAEQRPAEVRDAGGAARRRLAAGGARRRRQAQRQAQEEDEGEDDEAADDQQPGAPYASRKNAYEEKRQKRDEEREARVQAEEEAAERKEADRQAAEDAEAAKWLGQISVEQEGDEATEDAEQQGLLQAFVDFIRDRKTVVLEDLAAHFGLRVQDVIKRVQDLESMGNITGVMDDRGKFIYISREEMQAVADFIRRKGRVSVAELAAKSNTFIDLEEKAAEGEAEAVNLDLDLDKAATNDAEQTS